jgi:hypothetical protein
LIAVEGRRITVNCPVELESFVMARLRR